MSIPPFSGPPGVSTRPATTAKNTIKPANGSTIPLTVTAYGSLTDRIQFVTSTGFQRMNFDVSNVDDTTYWGGDFSFSRNGDFRWGFGTENDPASGKPSYFYIVNVNGFAMTVALDKTVKFPATDDDYVQIVPGDGYSSIVYAVGNPDDTTYWGGDFSFVRDGSTQWSFGVENDPAGSNPNYFYIFNAGASTTPLKVERARNIVKVRAFATNRQTKTADYTMTDDDSVVLANGTLTVTLPPVYDGREATVKDIGTGTVTVARGGSSLIDGATSQVLDTQYSALTVFCDGTDWFIV
jgi:hypothetical protein